MNVRFTTMLCTLVIVLGGTLVAATGCNTVEGAGEDVEAAGEGVQKGAKEVEEELF